MSKWMDLTNSLVSWKYGVVGIVRVELETARAIHKADPKVRFSICEEGGFREVTSDELNWLWDSDSAADAYATKMGRNGAKKIDSVTTRSTAQHCTPIQEALNYSASRKSRLKRAIYMKVASWPTPFRQVSHAILKVILMICQLMLGVLRAFNINRENIYEYSYVAGSEEQHVQHPYSSGDIIFSCGWMESDKERLYSKLKNETTGIKLVYLVYDIVLIKRGITQFYDKRDSTLFAKYLEWVSNNCDHVLYWGQVAEDDTENHFREHGLRVPTGAPVFYGSGMKVSTDDVQATRILEKLGVDEPYIIMVGSIEPRKNYDTIYRAYTIMSRKYDMKDIPKCVIVGGKVSCQNLVAAIEEDPIVSKKMMFLRPSDEELDVLYKNARFAMLPSLYEGWSLVLLEILNYGKFCLTSDVAPLREVAEGLVKYIDPMDPTLWADEIFYYSTHVEDVHEKERIIRQSWNPPAWDDGAKLILKNLSEVEGRDNNKHDIYYDLTLGWIYSHYNASISGIPRVHLLFARFLSRIYPDMKFFALTQYGYHSISKYDIAHVLGMGDIDKCFDEDKPLLSIVKGNKEIEDSHKQKSVHRTDKAYWMFMSAMPWRIMHKFDEREMARAKREVKERDEAIRSIHLELPFKQGDLIIGTGTGYDQSVYPELEKEKDRIGFKVAQLIYDMTPILLPQTHNDETKSNYTPFLKNTALLSDYIFYGGETAMRDCQKYQQEVGLPVRPGYPIRFGSEFSGNKVSEVRKKEIMDTYGIKEPYVITVGTIQARKNQETLYKAYTCMIDEGVDNIPQLVIVGFHGWNTEDFINEFNRDDRVRGKVLMLTLSDEELNCVYQNCLYTLLPSLYEGWSLTLPESLNYGKFCIASRVDPLIEIGGDYIDYVEPYDTKGWADKIKYYADHKDELQSKTDRIVNEYHSITWSESAKEMKKAIDTMLQ